MYLNQIKNKGQIAGKENIVHTNNVVLKWSYVNDIVY